MTSHDNAALHSLVEYARRLPRSGATIERAWDRLHELRHPVLRRAVATGERVADTTLESLPRMAPPVPESLVEREVDVDGIRVFFRASAREGLGSPTVHVHGFGVSGRYLLPTAGRLADEFATYVPDLPGYGRSANPPQVLDIPGLADALCRFFDAVGLERANLVGNSLGTAVSIEFARRFRDRTKRLVLVSPAGGLHNQPLLRGLAQIVVDAPREPLRLATVVVPDYLRFGLLDCVRLFRSMTRYPALDRLLALDVPALVVLGARDPLLPPARRVREVASAMTEEVTMVRLPGAAHAVNFSHPEVLAHTARCFLRDEPITAAPGRPGAIHLANVDMFERPS